MGGTDLLQRKAHTWRQGSRGECMRRPSLCFIQADRAGRNVSDRQEVVGQDCESRQNCHAHVARHQRGSRAAERRWQSAL